MLAFSGGGTRAAAFAYGVLEFLRRTEVVGISSPWNYVWQVKTTEEPPLGELIRQIREPVDLVITDIYMPDMDGLEVIRVARRLRPGLLVLAMSSGTGKHAILPVAKALGAAGTLPKPFAAEELRTAVRTCLAGCLAVHGKKNA